MKILFLVFLAAFAFSTQAAHERSVYPNSGPTNARRDEITNIPSFSSTTSQAIVPQEQQEDSGRKKKSPDDFIEGPYDRTGNYRYLPEIREE